MRNLQLSSVSDKSLYALAFEIKKELSGGGLTSDDNDFSIRHIEASIRHEWANLVKQEDELNERKGIPPSADRVKSFSCLKLEDNSDFSCKCTKYGGRFKKVTIPKMVNFKGTPVISFVGIMESGLKFIPVKDILTMNATSGLIKTPQYFHAGDSLYISLSKEYSLLCEIMVMGVPEDPTDEGDMCFDIFSAEWDCPEYMKARIKANVMAGMGRNVLTTLPNYDFRNNANPTNQFVTSRTP